MSQSGSYQYQTAYVNSNNSLKSGMLHLMNNQPNTVQHIQNGMQSPHSNFTGTPSSQSSRDPSRETSRDPSPTQYLHNQYRQQLPRPPIPPINGQQGINPNVGASSLPITQTHKYSPPTIPYVHTQFGSTNAVSSSNTANTASAFASLSSNVQMNQNSNVQTVSPGTQGPLLNSNHNTLSDPHVIGRVVSSSFTGIKPTVTGTEQSYRWASNFGSTTNIGNTLIMSTSTDNLSNQSQRSGPIQVPSSQCLGQSSSVTPIFTPNKQNESQNVPMISQNQAAAPSAINPSYSSENTKHLSLNTGSLQSQSQNASSESQTADVVTPQNIPSHSSQPKYGNQQNAFNIAQHTQNSPNTISPFMHSTNSSTQNLFLYSQQNQLPSQSPNLSGSQNIINAQEYHPKELKPQVPYLQQSPTQNILGSHTDSHGLGLGLNQNQIAYNTQQNLASQRNYSQNLYGTQLPPNTANMLNPGMVPPRIGEPLTSPSQLPPKQVSNMPPFPGQQLQNQYDARSQFSGQMSNIPLDSMTKRYPSSYPEQMNQLNNQMNNMSVTQSGFNKIWGMESIDLLQCRNILPSEKIESPKIKLHQEFLDSINCSPDIFRCTLTKIPESNSLLQKSRLPLGILIHPFKDLNHLPVIQCSTIVRCRACRTYINPFVYFVDSKRWKCNLCYRINDLPEEFQFDPVTKSYGDPSRRPEVKTSTIEFIAPSEYMLRPPQPAVYLFILDVSRLAVDTGYLSITCNVISEKLTRLPGDGRTQVGFLAIDSAIHFFSMPDNVSQPHEMIMLDVDDVFLPCPDNLIVNLKEREELIKDLLVQLPTKFQNTHDTNCALGAGLQAAYKLMSPTGGRITVFQTCLPNLGPGVLQAREDPNSRTNKDVPHLNPATDFYKRLALDCSGQQIAVDLFLLNSQYSDLATLSGMCKFSGGCIYHIPLFRASKLQSRETLDRILRRYLTRKIGFEAVMRIRCTRGLSIHTFHGNFFVRSTDLLSLPNINPDAGFGMQISIEENLSDVQNVCFQAALLYTSSKGERRIRVHTLCLPIVTSLTDVLFSADQQCIIGLLSKMAVDRSQQSSLSDARDALINVAIDVLSVYKMSQSIASGGLLAPSSLKLLPLYIISLLKCIAFRSGTNTRLDDRVYAMCQLKTLPLFQLIQMVYPDLYPVHTFDDRNSKDIDGKICPQPPRLHLSAAKLDSRGVFLMDAGDKILIYVGKNIHPSFCCNVLGVSAFATIPEEFYELPEFDNIESEKFRNFVFSLQEEKPFYASIQIIRDDSHFRTLFVERLIEDRSESALSYHEFLQHLKTQVK